MGRTRRRARGQRAGHDAAGLAFNALEQAIAQKIDILIVDTAGRLQSNAALMDELGKIIRVLGKQCTRPARHALVLMPRPTKRAHSSAGFSGYRKHYRPHYDQAGRHCARRVSGSGGDKIALPVHFIGVGEQAEDLQEFSADEFSRALTGAEL